MLISKYPDIMALICMSLGAKVSGNFKKSAGAALVPQGRLHRRWIDREIEDTPGVYSKAQKPLPLSQSGSNHLARHHTVQLFPHFRNLCRAYTLSQTPYASVASKQTTITRPPMSSGSRRRN